MAPRNKDATCLITACHGNVKLCKVGLNEDSQICRAYQPAASKSIGFCTQPRLRNLRVEINDLGLLIPRRFRPLGEQLQRLNCRESDLLDECDDRSVARQNKIALTKEESLRQGRRSQQCAVETSNAKAKRPRARKSECIIPPRVPDEALTAPSHQ